MKSLRELRLQPGLMIEQTGIDGGCGRISFKTSKRPAVAVWSFGGGWEHVEECVVQYHPPASRYVNQHPYCLHLWRPTKQDMPMPPRIFVGVE